MKKLGLIVNPIAGMGGKVGLKGTDGEEALARAIALGAQRESPLRAASALRRLSGMRDRFMLFTARSDLGERVARDCGFAPRLLDIAVGERTTARHTREAAERLRELEVDLVLFAGGDGTARDIVAAIQDHLVCVGIPAGVKMHSAVFAVNPSRAGDLVASYLGGETKRTRAAEVMDVDEEALRQGRLSARLFGYLRVVQQAGGVQKLKSASRPEEAFVQEAIAAAVIEQMASDVVYIIGPGTTTAAIMRALGVDFSLLGVDVVCNRGLEGKDLSESQLLRIVDRREAKIVVTPIGGQGYLFGRGNQPISARLIRRIGRENILIVATARKLGSLRGSPLKVDTGEPETDRLLDGYYRVVTGYHSRAVYRVSPE